jgi:hypothetical protein
MSKARSVAMTTVWKVDMEDLSHLGGPMGSEYTTPLGSKVFKSDTDAIDFINRKITRKSSYWPVMKIKHKDYFDCGWIGFRIERVIL